MLNFGDTFANSVDSDQDLHTSVLILTKTTSQNNSQCASNLLECVAISQIMMTCAMQYTTKTRVVHILWVFLWGALWVFLWRAFNQSQFTKTEPKKTQNNCSRNIQMLVSLKQSSYSFRYENTLQIPTVRTVAYGKKSFCFEAARVWNSLPDELRKVSAF